jgi:hypothetical protein
VAEPLTVPEPLRLGVTVAEAVADSVRVPVAVLDAMALCEVVEETVGEDEGRLEIDGFPEAVTEGVPDDVAVTDLLAVAVAEPVGAMDLVGMAEDVGVMVVVAESVGLSVPLAPGSLRATPGPRDA